MFFAKILALEHAIDCKFLPRRRTEIALSAHHVGLRVFRGCRISHNPFTDPKSNL